jgi:hypothetical protein
MEPLYPNITVQLVGTDGNAFAVMARVKQALSRAGVEKKRIQEFLDECMSGDYDHLLQTCIKWVNVT